MPSNDLEQAVLAHVRDPAYRPVKPRIIAKNLRIEDLDVEELKKTIKKLVREGKLAYGPSHLVRASEAAASGWGPDDVHRVTGVFRRMSGGYGFVRPSAATSKPGATEDIYIAARNAGDASSGDTVLVRLRTTGRRPGGPEGEIFEVVERETNQFVGTYFEQAGLGLVQIDGKLFTKPILVGDPGAKGAQPDDKVVVEMVRFPSHAHDGEGVITEVLGPAGMPGVDTLSIIREYNLPGPFADDAMEAARTEAEAFDESLEADRLDLTGETVITIDPADARDFDDAISLEELKGGHWRLGVHIADVSHFVRPKHALDREALDRATSVYLPDRVIPMLPEIISNNLASLQPGRVRYCLTAHIEMTADGARVDCEVSKSAIKSKRRFTYEEVDQYLANPGEWRTKLQADVHALLGSMHRLAMILRRRRFERGSLELSIPEVKVKLDRDGRVEGAFVTENTESHQIIEEFMLAANEAVASKLAEEKLLFMRRVHQAPDPRKLEALTEFVHELGFKTESLVSRFAIQKLLDAVRGLPQQHAVHYAALRSMQKAIYSPEDEGHYALASDCYCHFTSPIRRYPDLTVHRLLKTLIEGKRPRQDEGELAGQAAHCSEREQRAAQAERDLVQVKLLHYLSKRIGEEMDGIITGVEKFGLFIQGVELPAEGFVHISALQDDYYHFDRTTHSLTGYRKGNTYRLGDPVRVAVASVDVARRELDFRLLGRSARVSVPSQGKPPRTKAGASKAPAKKKKPAAKKPTGRKKKRRK